MTASPENENSIRFCASVTFTGKGANLHRQDSLKYLAHSPLNCAL